SNKSWQALATRGTTRRVSQAMASLIISLKHGLSSAKAHTSLLCTASNGGGCEPLTGEDTTELSLNHGASISRLVSKRTKGAKDLPSCFVIIIRRERDVLV